MNENFRNRVNAFRIFLILLIAVAPALIRCSKEKSPVTTDPEKFIYMTEEYPPFNYSENGKACGVSVDILVGIFKRMNLSVDLPAITVSNWATAYEITLNTPGTMLFSMVRTPQREPLFKWVGPIAPHADVAITMKDSGIEISDVTDLNNIFTGVIEGYSSLTTLTDHGVLRSKIIIYKGLAELYRALVVDREVQCISYSLAGHLLIIQSFGYPENIFATPFPIHSEELYYAFNIESDDKMIADFQDRLDLIKYEKAPDGSSEYEKIFIRYSIIQFGTDGITPQMVVNLVDRTGADLEADASGTISRMNQGLPPYKDPVNPALYSFVYDTLTVLVAHADNLSMVGKSYAGKPDAAGKNFRDEIVAGALAHGTGWVDYVYTKPDQSGLYYKTSYYKLVRAGNAERYIVCAGRYK